MAITIKDVAEEAGVSTSTVSKVLNHWTTISPETTDRVNRAIEKLHYVPNARAVSFAKGATMNILFLSTFTKEQAYSNPHMFDILCGAQKALSERNYHLMLADPDSKIPPEDFIEDIISQKIADGIIIHGSAFTPKLTKPLLAHEFPHIVIGHPKPAGRLCWIDTNNGLAGEFAAQHMLRCGYEKIAFIGSRKTDDISMQRLNGFLGVMYEYGYSVSQEYLGYTDSSVPGSYEKALEMLALPKPPRAIVCENNTIAIGVMRAIEEKKLCVPQEIALLTFDRYPYSRIISPLPTIIDIDVYDLGVQAVDMLFRKLENPSFLVQSYATLPVLIQGLTTQIL